MTARVLAVIPARGGSRRIPRKNVRTINGRPLIAHTISQADDSERIDRCVVSTDDDEIKRVARKYGGEVPFRRPPEFATDTAPMSDVITHTLNWFSAEDKTFDIVCLLQVTCPLRRSADIDSALTELDKSGADSVISISEYPVPPQWAVTRREDNYLTEYYDPPTLWTDEPERTQDIQKLWHPNGAVFAAYVDKWEKDESFYLPRTIGYEMPIEQSFDIDEPWELELVRALMAENSK